MLNDLIESERKQPVLSAHNFNSYRTNLPVAKENQELRDILHYFDDPADFLPLYQEKEFRNGLLIEVKGELINEKEREMGVKWRESLYHNHDFFEMLYVARGKCTHWIGEQKKQLEEGDLLVFNLETVHKVLIDDQSAVFEILVGREVFSKTFLELFSQEDPISRFYIHSIYDISGSDYLVFHLADRRDLRFFLDDMILTQAQKKGQYERQTQLDFTQLLTRLSDLLSDLSSQSVREDQQAMSADEVLWYIHMNYRELTLEGLSDHFGYGPRTMTRFLKKHLHKTFKEIVQEYRLLNACTLLRSSDLTIEEICEEIGIAERSYLNRLFRNEFSVTPAAYRTRFRSGN